MDVWSYFYDALGANKTQMWHWVCWVSNNLPDKHISIQVSEKFTPYRPLRDLSKESGASTFRVKPTSSYAVLGMSENVIRSSETWVKYWPGDTSCHPGRLSHINTADRTSNFLISAPKMQAPSSSETTVLSSWHLLPSWKTKSFQHYRQNVKSCSFYSKNTGTPVDTYHPGRHL